MKKILLAMTTALFFVSASAVSSDGRNPCKWESDPKPGFCPASDEARKNSSKGKYLGSVFSEKRGGDNR